MVGRRMDKTGRSNVAVNAGADDGSDAASAATATASGGAASEVYVACTPLVGLEAMGVVMGDKYPGRLEHTMVIVRHAGAKGVTAFDFLPTDPRSPLTAAALLAGTSVPGRALRSICSSWHSSILSPITST